MKTHLIILSIVLSQLTFSQNRSSRSAFWSEDFANGMNGNNGDGAWTTSGPDSAVWKHSFYGSSGEFSGSTPQPNTSTAANGFMLFDADSVNFINSPVYQNLSGSLISPKIDLSAEGSVVISFEHWFQYCCKLLNFELMLGVSNDDGATWHEIPVDDNLPSSALGQNPTLVSLNISPYAANQDSVRLRFRWGNVPHYFWVIDDIQLREAPPYDLELQDFVWETDYVGHPGFTTHGLHYTTVPSSDEYAFLFSGTSHNAGSLTIDSWLELEITDPIGSVTTLYSDTTLLAPLDSVRDTLRFQLPSIDGDYDFKLQAMTDNISLDTSHNNLDSVRITNTSHGIMFSKDNGLSSNIGAWNGDNGNGTSNGFVLVTAFRFKEVTSFCEIEVHFHPNSDIGALVYPVVYHVDSTNGNFVLDYVGYDYPINSNYQLNMLVQNNGTIEWDTATTYLLGVGHYGGPDKTVVLMSDHRSEFNQSTFLYDPSPIGAPWNILDRAPFIRPYFDIWTCIGSSDDISSDIAVSIHPNPSVGNIYLSWDEIFKPTVFHIYSSDGKLVKSGTVNQSVNEFNLDCTNVENGVYSVTLIGDKGVSSQQFIIAR